MSYDDVPENILVGPFFTMCHVENMSLILMLDDVHQFRVSLGVPELFACGIVSPSQCRLFFGSVIYTSVCKQQFYSLMFVL